jgi:luciferase family oxidoreductase group 1
VAAIAGATDRMRVGSGGVLLPYYSPRKVAESFGMLEALYPGRIDLGVGRAPGADARTALLLRRDRHSPLPDDFRDQLVELLGYLEGAVPVAGTAVPAGLAGVGHRPEPWLLGSSLQSAIWAAELGIPYAFGDFFTPQGPQIVALYRDRFLPSRRWAEPRVIVGIHVVCAESDDEAERLASSRYVAFAQLTEGRADPMPPPDRALRYLADRDVDPEHLPGRRGAIGSPETVRSQLEEVAGAYGAEEVLLMTWVWDHEARRRSYELVAAAFAHVPADRLEPSLLSGP